jgi:general secretion pathway protein K
VALITALLVVAMATAAAVAMVSRQQVDIRRSANLLAADQALLYADGVEDWAAQVLRRDRDDGGKSDNLGEDWATRLPPISVEGGQITGGMEDLQGRFNLNNLVDQAGKVRAEEMEYFRRLLDNLGIEQALADALADWIDRDIDVRFPNGAEDEYYLLQEPPYRAANRPLVDTSELRLVKGFTDEVMQLLAPHVTALSEETMINVNTATPQVLRALNADLSESDVEKLIADRGENGYENPNDFLGHSTLAGRELGTQIDVTSNFFRVLTSVDIGDSTARLASLLQRDDGDVRVISRLRSRFYLLVPEAPAEEAGDQPGLQLSD